MTSMTHDNPKNITPVAEWVADHRVTQTQPECPEWCEVSQEDHEAEASSRISSWYAHSRRVAVGDASIYVGSCQLFEEQVENEAQAADEATPRIWISGLDMGEGLSAAQALELADALAEVAGRERPVVAIFEAGREFQRRVDDRQEVMVSVGDASHLTGLSERQVREAIGKGDLAAGRRGRRFAIPLHALAAWRESLPKAV